MTDRSYRGGGVNESLTPQLRVLWSALAGVILGLAIYLLGGVVWRCLVLAFLAGLVTWLATGSLARAAQKWPARIEPATSRRPIDPWMVPALGIVMIDPSLFESRLRRRLLALAEQGLAARQLTLHTDLGRAQVGDRTHDILCGIGDPPRRSEIERAILTVSALNEHSGSGGARAIDEALLARRSKYRPR